MKLQQQVRNLAHAYVRKGGKKNRKQQVARMLALAEHCEGKGATEIGQIGGKHVISYWRSLRSKGGLADATLYSHWLAIRELWQLADKVDEPPRPLMKRNEHDADVGSIVKKQDSDNFSTQ